MAAGFSSSSLVKAEELSQDNPGWNFAFTHPYAAGLAAVGPLSGVAAASGGEAAYAFWMAAAPGVGGAFAAQQTFAGLVYSALAPNSLGSIGGTINDLSKVNSRKPSTAAPSALSFGFNVGPAIAGGYAGAISDAYQFGILQGRL